ncbi:hypothetical protein V3324_29765, partial [Pseudomonas aeruginosa]
MNRYWLQSLFEPIKEYTSKPKKAALQASLKIAYHKNIKLAGIYIHIPFCRKACHYCDFHFSTGLGAMEDMGLAIC